jgi:large subunit ribosomal protein L23
MIKADLYDILRFPVITEKAQSLLDKAQEVGQGKKYTFKVEPKTTKAQVKKAVEDLFNVKVSKVNSMNVPGKTITFKGVPGKERNYKKVVVTLEKGGTIDYVWR